MLCHPYRQSIMTDERESCAVVAGYLARGDRAELAWPGEPLLTTPEGLADRYRGSLLWGAVGDALGRAVEGRSPATIRDQFGEQGLREYVKWHGWQSGPTGTITDDTQLTIEVARSLLSTDGQLDPDDLVGRLVAWLPRGRGVPRATWANRRSGIRSAVVAGRARTGFSGQRGSHARGADRTRARVRLDTWRFAT
jgi:hypothetical protein